LSFSTKITDPLLALLTVNSASFSPLPEERHDASGSKKGIDGKTFKPHKILYPMKNTGSNENGVDCAWKGMMPSDMVNMIVNMASSSASFHSESHPKLSRARSLLLSSFLSSSSGEAKQSSNSAFTGRQKRKRHDVEDDNEDASLEEDRLALALIDSVDVSLDDSFHTWQP